MLIETNGFIIVAIEQPFSMKPRLVDQTWQMHVPAKFFVRTAWMQPLHWGRRLSRRQRHGRRTRKAGLPRARGSQFSFRQQFPLGETSLTNNELAGKDPAFLHCDRLGRDIPLERTLFLDGNNCLGNDFTRHRSLDFDARDSHPAEAVDTGFTFDNYMSSSKTARNSS